MERDRHGRRGDDDRFLRLFGLALAGLLALTVVAVALTSMNSGDVRHAPQTVAETPGQSPAPAPENPKPEPAAVPTPEPTPSPIPTPTTTPTASSQEPPTAPTRARATIPERMRRIPAGSTQIVIITGTKIGSNTGTLAVYNKDNDKWSKVMTTHANLGKNGLVDGEKRTSGHLQTPTGIWHIGSLVFGLHSSPPSGTRMDYRHITNNSWWSAERNSTYNSWVTSKSHVNGEHLADADPQYEYAFDTGYNSLPNKQVKGRGTAIFIHCFEPPGNSLGKFTHGCIAIDRKKMISLFRILDPARNPTCAIGTLKKGSPTSIWAY